MKTACRLLIVCLAVLGATLINCATESGKQEMPETKESPAFTLDMERPFAFLKEHLPHALDEAPSGSLAWDAIERITVVRVHRGDAAADMEVELIAGGVLPASKRYSILLSGTPATLDDTYALALKLCELADIPNDRIVAWYKKGHESALTSAEDQIERVGEREHSVNVRSSLELEGDKLWRVLYTIYFPRPEGAPDDEHSEKARVRSKDQNSSDQNISPANNRGRTNSGSR